KGGCLVGSGSGGLTLTDDEVRELAIAMQQPLLPCGTPAAKLVVQVSNAPGSQGAISGMGIDCGQDCEEVYPVGTKVTLRAQAKVGSFLGWAGGCMGTDDCELTLSKPGTVTVQALFGIRPCVGWCQEPSGVTQNLYGIFGTSPARILAVGAAG